MGIIIPFTPRPRAGGAATLAEAVGGGPGGAKTLIFPHVQVRDIRRIWGMMVEGPPHTVPDACAFSDGKPPRAKSPRVKRKPARRCPK